MKTKRITESNNFIPNATVGDPFWRPTAPENIAFGVRGVRIDLQMGESSLLHERHTTKASRRDVALRKS